MTVWDKLSKKYDSIWVQKYSLTPTRREVLKRIKVFAPKTVLDIGCGTGQLIAQLMQDDAEVDCTGCDKSEGMIRQAERKNLKADFFIWDIGDSPEGRFPASYDLIVCTHSFPYYPDKPSALKKIYDLMEEKSLVIFVQGSVNSLYDRIVMSGVEKTAEKAEYLSKREFLQHTASLFDLVEQFDIKEKWFMPSICGFVMRKRKNTHGSKRNTHKNKESIL
jgi:ubiquinone/menaquinone biosynthesis C-methylase UbiE